MSSLVSTFHDTAVSPETWPHALTALTDAAGVALIILNKSTGNVDEPCFSGLSAGRKSDYVRHYAAGDPYSPLLDRRLEETLRLSSGLRVTEVRVVQRFCIDVRRSRYSRNEASRYVDSLHLRYSPADRS